MHLVIFLLTHKKVFEIMVELLVFIFAYLEKNSLNSKLIASNINLINSPGIQFSSNLNFGWIKYISSSKSFKL